MLYIFFKYPLLGCGTGELQNALIYQFLHSPIILTPEIASKILSDYPGINPSVFFGILAEQGFIGLILYFLIIFFTIKKSINISKYLSHQIANFIIGLVHVMCIFIILSFYDSYVYTPILWLIIGIIYGFANKYNRTTMKGKPNENINS